MHIGHSIYESTGNILVTITLGVISDLHLTTMQNCIPLLLVFQLLPPCNIPNFGLCIWQLSKHPLVRLHSSRNLEMGQQRKQFASALCLHASRGAGRASRCSWCLVFFHWQQQFSLQLAFWVSSHLSRHQQRMVSLEGINVLQRGNIEENYLNCSILEGPLFLFC